MTSSGIEPATLRFVAQHLNHSGIAVLIDITCVILNVIILSMFESLHSLLYSYTDVLVYKLFALLLSVYRLHPFYVYVTGETNVASVNVAVNTHQSSRLVWKWFCSPKRKNE